jgi:rhodanese-related sulfurtransferase
MRLEIRFLGRELAMSPTTVVTIVLLILAVLLISRQVLGKAKPADARRLVAEGAILLDVRTAGEFNDGHLQAARNIPVQELSSRLGELGDKRAPIVVYCASGMRSSSATALLRGAGFEQVFDLGARSRWGDG